MINKSREDYLRAIYHLQEEQDNTKGCNSIDISNYLQISKSSVSEMLRKLTDEDLINSELYGKVKLTNKGKKIAIEMTRKHRIIEVFLKEILKIKGKKIHEEAHLLEHAFSDESIEALSNLIDNKISCPHGKKIPLSGE